MSDAIERIGAELKKRGRSVYAPIITPAAAAARNLRGKPSIRPRATPGDALWREEQFYKALAEEQAKDPNFLPEYSGVRDWESLYQFGISRRQSDGEEADQILSKATGTARIGTRLIAGLGKGLTDPTSYIPLPGAGGGTSVARAILNTGLREAGANVAVGAAMEPLVRADAAALGKERTMSDTAADLGVQALAGFVIGGGAEGINQVRRRFAGDRAAIDQFRKSVPEENWMPDERAAVNVLERNESIMQASPYLQNRTGDSAHLDSLAKSLALTQYGSNAPDTPVRRAPSLSDANFRSPASAAFMARVRRVESGGSDLAAAATSSAYGRYQFTKGTWLSYFKRRYPSSGLSDASILAKRSDGALQDVLMRDLTEDNSRSLGGAGLEVTPTSLYTMHFAGPADGVRILRASLDTPIEQVMRPESVAANAWLRGKTVGDFLNIVKRKMGDADVPVAVDGNAFSTPDLDDGAVRSAIELRDVFEQEADPEGLLDSDYPQLRPEPFSTVEEHARAQLRDFERTDAQAGFAVPDHHGEMWRQGIDQMSAADSGIIDNAIEHPALGPVDVEWRRKIANDEASDGLALIVERDPELAALLPDLVERMTVIEQRADRAIMASEDGRAVAEFSWNADKGRWTLSRSTRNGDTAAPSGKKPASPKLPNGRPEDFAAYVSQVAGAERWVVASRMTPDLRARGYEAAIPPRQFDAIRKEWDTLSPEVMAQYRSRPSQAVGNVDIRPVEPRSSDEARIVDVLEHDIRMLAEGPDADHIALESEDGRVVSLRQILAEIDEDEAASAALRACLTPRKAA
ncbi:MAG: hypothetical protein AB1431_07345 [Pseudomonadota bacterium]